MPENAIATAPTSTAGTGLWPTPRSMFETLAQSRGNGLRQRVGLGRRDHERDAELLAFLEAPFGLRRRAQPSRQADLAERGEPFARGRAFPAGGKGEPAGEFASGPVDATPAGDVDE